MNDRQVRALMVKLDEILIAVSAERHEATPGGELGRRLCCHLIAIYDESPFGAGDVVSRALKPQQLALRAFLEANIGHLGEGEPQKRLGKVLAAWANQRSGADGMVLTKMKSKANANRFRFVRVSGVSGDQSHRADDLDSCKPTSHASPWPV